MEKQDKISVIQIAPGEAHLQNEVVTNQCYVCHKPQTNEMPLLRIKGKIMAPVCTHHPGVVQEFIRQYKTVPLGWEQTVSDPNER